MVKTIFFDWDGTLYSKEASQKANIERLRMICGDSFDEQEMIDAQHNNNNDHYAVVRQMISDALGITNPQHLKEIQGSAFAIAYLKIINDKPQRYTLVDFEKLRELKKKYNLKFVIVTSLYNGTIGGVLNKLGAGDLFDGVYGCNVDLGTNKFQNLQKALEDYKDKNPLLMAGDRGEDIDAGARCGLKTVFCSYGHGQVDNADYTIDDPEDFIGVLTEIVENN
jgi:phosphoglycolate phosphatase-like HAD superfamily hydrolase